MQNAVNADKNFFITQCSFLIIKFWTTPCSDRNLSEHDI